MNIRVLQGLAALVIVALAVPTWAKDEPAETTVICKDGSTSKGGKGACSGHGGVDKKATKAATRPAEATKETTSSVGAAAETTVICKDGSTSKGGKGACSGHGGVDKKATKAGAKAAAPAAGASSATAPSASSPVPAATAPTKPGAAPAAAAQGTGSAKATAPANAKNTDPTGAIAKCKDGTYSHAKSHSGACSRHGGVAEWLDKPAQ